MKPLKEIFEEAAKLKQAAVDIVIAAYEPDKQNMVSYAEGILHFYPTGKAGAGACPLFWSNCLNKFINIDRYKNSKGLSCPFDGERDQNDPYEVTIAEEKYISKLTLEKITVPKTSTITTGRKKPKILGEVDVRYKVRIIGLTHSLAADFIPNYEPTSGVLTAVVPTHLQYSKFVTMRLNNLRKTAIEPP